MRSTPVDDFDYELPEELIAQQPPAERGTSRMLVVDRATGAFRDDFFSGFGQHLRRGDLLVLNDSRVIPARLYARRTLRREREKPTGRIEVMLTEPAGENQWRALVRPGRKIAIGERLVFPAPGGAIVLEAEVLERGQYGERLLEFSPVENSAGDFFAVLDRIGHMPLPPYIHRDDCGLRSRPLPDSFRTRTRLGRRTHGRSALHAANARLARRMRRRDRTRHAPRRPGHLRAAAR